MVNQLLPLPFLRSGFLQAMDPERIEAIDEQWRTCWFVLDHVSLRTAPLQQRGGQGQNPYEIPTEYHLEMLHSLEPQQVHRVQLS